jgi:hypothetical protein
MMTEESAPHFANVVHLTGMTGGNAHLVNGFYSPVAARKFSFPVYAKCCERTNAPTATTLSLHYQSRRYYWVIRDEEQTILARVAYPAQTSTTLSLPEHVPNTQLWELRSTGFLKSFKKKPTARVNVCSDTAILQQMSSFIGRRNGHMDSVSESIRFIDTTVRDLEDSILSPTSQQYGHNDNTGTSSDDQDIDLDELILLYSQEVFNGYGSLIPHDQASRQIPFSTLQEELETQVTKSLASVVDMEKELSKLADSAPEEFIDPITMSIMLQPMKVPTSPYILDRKTLVDHLAINQTDPFSRRALTLDMIIPDVALQIRIENWLQEKGVQV